MDHVIKGNKKFLLKKSKIGYYIATHITPMSTADEPKWQKNVAVAVKSHISIQDNLELYVKKFGLVNKKKNKCW